MYTECLPGPSTVLSTGDARGTKENSILVLRELTFHWRKVGMETVN